MGPGNVETQSCKQSNSALSGNVVLTFTRNGRKSEGREDTLVCSPVAEEVLAVVEPDASAIGNVASEGSDEQSRLRACRQDSIRGFERC